MKTKKMAFGGTSAVPLQQRLATGAGPMQPQMPPQSNAGGAMRGQDRADMMRGGLGGQGRGRGPAPAPAPQIQPGATPPPIGAPAPQIQPAYIKPGTLPTGDRSNPIAPTQQQLQSGIPSAPMPTQQYQMSSQPIGAVIGAPAPAGAMFKKGGKVKEKAYAKGGSVKSSSSASRRGDGIAQRGKTRGKMV